MAERCELVYLDANLADIARTTWYSREQLKFHEKVLPDTQQSSSWKQTQPKAQAFNWLSCKCLKNLLMGNNSNKNQNSCCEAKQKEFKVNKYNLLVSLAFLKNLLSNSREPLIHS